MGVFEKVKIKESVTNLIKIKPKYKTENALRNTTNIVSKQKYLKCRKASFQEMCILNQAELENQTRTQ